MFNHMNKKKITLFLSISTIITLFLGELFARYILGLGDPPLSISHPKIEYMYKPNQDVSRFGNRILINQYGMRSQNFPRKKKSIDETRIMIFGDSVINGGNLTDHKDLATTIVQNEVSKSLTQPVIVGNISAGSWGPGNWLAYAQEYGFFQADIIILVLSSHDWSDNPSFKPLNPTTHPQDKPILALQEGVTRYLPRYLPDIPELNAREKVETQEKSSSHSNQEKGLRDLKVFLRMARQHSQQVIVFHHPELSELKSGKFKKGYHKFFSLCQELGTKNISLKPYYEERKKPDNLYRDFIHPNEKGQQLLAQGILEELKTLSWYGDQ